MEEVSDDGYIPTGIHTNFDSYVTIGDPPVRNIGDLEELPDADKFVIIDWKIWSGVHHLSSLVENIEEKIKELVSMQNEPVTQVSRLNPQKKDQRNLWPLHM